MGCLENRDTTEVEELYYRGAEKGYAEPELLALIDLVDSSVLWLDTLNTDAEDIVALRVGIPNLRVGPTDADEVYGYVPGEDVYLLRSIGIDMIKITERSGRHNLTYTYKSKFRHDILGAYFIDGVSNNTDLLYLDTLEPDYSATAGLYVEYGGVPGLSSGIAELPVEVLHCITYMSQNLGLLRAFKGEAGKVGDLLYMTVPGFRQRLIDIKAECNRKIARYVGPIDQDIYDILDGTGMAQAFEDIQYGGELEDLQLLMRIPASYSNEIMLRGLLEEQDVRDMFSVPEGTEVTEEQTTLYFNSIFPSEFVAEEAHEDRYIAEHQKVEDFLDVDRVNEVLAVTFTAGSRPSTDQLWLVNNWFDTVYTADDYVTINNISHIPYTNTKGCKQQYTTIEPDGGEGGGTHEVVHNTYRHYAVSEVWFKAAPREVQALIFWAGLDLRKTSNDACGLDQIIMIVIIIIVTYFTAGLGTATAMTVAEGMALAAGIISIGLTMGVFGTGKTARNMQILATLLSLGSAVSATTAATTVSMNQAMVMFAQSVSAITKLVEITEAFDHNEDMENMEATLDILEEEGEMYESELRFTFSTGFDAHVRGGVEADPYAYMGKQFDRFTATV